MSGRPGWYYDEMRHSGVNYSDAEQVAVFDSNHQKFRDYEKQTAAIISAVGIGPEDTVIDMGCGTGAFALHAAPRCKTIYAVDVSPLMLDYARAKAQSAGLANIVFCPGGFLTYEHQAPLVDAVVCVAALHHLPDFWKQIGLRRVAQMLKPGGRFYLFDVVFPSDPPYLAAGIDRWVAAMSAAVGPEFAAEVETHIRDEHSTYDWVLEGMLARSGFRIDSASFSNGFEATYLCTRVQA